MNNVASESQKIKPFTAAGRVTLASFDAAGEADYAGINRARADYDRYRHEANNPFHQIDAIAAYLNRIHGYIEWANLRRAIIQERVGDGGYWKDMAVIRFGLDGEVSLQNFRLTKAEAEEYTPTDAEREAIREGIKAALAGGTVPRSSAIPFHHFHHHLPNELKSVDPATLSLFRSADGKKILFIEQRIETDSGKIFIPWTPFDDREWRKMEPDNGVPLFGLERLKERAELRVMLHEGPGTARAVRNMSPGHPWKSEMEGFVHLAWSGGAFGINRVDLGPLRKMAPGRLITICADNDDPGREAVADISELLSGRHLEWVRFDDRFPATFDLKDPWPEIKAWWRGERYIGPSLDELTHPATWATWEGKSKNGRPPIYILKAFAKEWWLVSNPPVFIHREWPYRRLPAPEFNSEVQPFSHIKGTARLMGGDVSSHVSGLAYRPGEKQGIITIDGVTKVNCWRPTAVIPELGSQLNIIPPKHGSPDVDPFLEYMEHLVPDEEDRIELLRWIATLIAHPDVRMTYSVLLIGPQGCGKSTLGEKILKPLVGEWNTTTPNEAILNSAFNEWVAFKRLCVIHEIYAGGNRKMYDRLKSLVTEHFLTINEKFLPAYGLDICLHILACSNSEKALHLDPGDRRWLVPKVTEKLLPHSYWKGFNEWLEGVGLGRILAWAPGYLEDHGGPIRSGEEAPLSKAKSEMILDSMSPGTWLADDLAEHVAVMASDDDFEELFLQRDEQRKPGERTVRAPGDRRVVLIVDEVRQWVANQRGLDLNDSKMEGLLTVRRALITGGLRESVDVKGNRRRMKIEGRMKGVVGNFEIDVDATWGKDLKDYYLPPEVADGLRVTEEDSEVPL